MNVAQRILTSLIRAYQAVLSPALGAFFGPAGRCRYTPSCSRYALEAVRVHGALAGTFLAVKRLCRCNPWASFGEDPVPDAAARPGKAGIGCACNFGREVRMDCGETTLSRERAGEA